jgi:sortase A
MRVRVRITLSFVIAMAGMAMVLAAGGQWLWDAHQERQDRLEFIRQLDAPAAPALAYEKAKQPVGLGVLRIERLGMEVLIRQGADHSALSQGAGWIPGTARPGARGNVGIAAHRDTFFRELQSVRAGDLVKLLTPAGERVFRVDTMRIVEPTEVDVLKPTRSDALTLVTCFPFDFVGSAPQRFIVRATALPGGQSAVRAARQLNVPAKRVSQLHLPRTPALRFE